ncbi:hypothetical protein [Paenibacillus sp. HJGM_3]|uniref:hypothetical protein n=1 Tax=Paenibacillus sp. HJGM_3 TaxID=3379816 RepID=UPI00385AED00
MQVFSTFETSLFLEMAIATLTQKGIPSESIFAVPLDNRQENHKILDTLHRSDGTSLIDIGFAVATGFSVIGASIGFRLAWGPIYWGLIGGFVGFVLGFAIRLFIELAVKKRRRVLRGKHSEVILIVDCEDSQAELIESILWSHLALGVAKVQ